ncbi:hypothetical protein EDD15DRAFT_384657 [Pisolithus albus]|nr:hypothetical protein EDD15DRAFT_384657 [Pisolithus albus]
MGSTGSGELAEPEGARTPPGVGSRTQDIREREDSVRPPIQVLHMVADWLGRDSVELQQAIESICSWYHRSAMTIAYISDFSDIAGVPVRHPKHFCPGSVGLDRALSMRMGDARSRPCRASCSLGRGSSKDPHRHWLFSASGKCGIGLRSLHPPCSTTCIVGARHLLPNPMQQQPIYRVGLVALLKGALVGPGRLDSPLMARGVGHSVECVMLCGLRYTRCW